MSDDKAEEVIALLASISESLRILCDMAERASYSDEEG